MEQAMLAGVRVVHFASAIVLFGGFVHRTMVVPAEEKPAAIGRTAAWAILVLLATALIWLGLEAVSMSGLPPAEALSADTLVVVATKTIFGCVWIARFTLGLALAMVLGVLHRRTSQRGAQAIGTLLAALILATIAGAGHAVADDGVDRVVHLSADALHLLAAGAWLGALLPFIVMLSQSPELQFASRAAQRFSTLGVASMAAIVLSGVVNGCYMLPNIAALTDSQYGRLLLAKMTLFLAIMAVAAFNRVVLTPRLAGASGNSTLRRLKTTAILECVLGFGIVAIVGQLGITMPEFHAHH